MRAGLSSCTLPSVRSGPMPADLSSIADLLRSQRDERLHLGAQAYVSRHGETLLDIAVGESRAGRDLRPDDVMLWYSSTKPLTVVALLQLWEQGKLGLDDRVTRYVDGWGAGKERCTIRHILVHTGGFPMRKEGVGDLDEPFADKVRRIAAHPAEWDPGTQAAYHLTTGWTILGAIVEQVDGRPVQQYVAEEIFEPVGMAECFMGVPSDEQDRLGDRLAPVHWLGHEMPRRGPDGQVEMVPYDIEKRGHNKPWYRSRVEPGSSGQGAAHHLARFYEALLGHGPELLQPATIEVMTAMHRFGMRDRMFANLKIPWGLGVQVSAAISGGPGRRAFGHGGMASSLAFADPDADLVGVIVTNGLPKPLDNEQRIHEFVDAVYQAFGEELAPIRRPGRAPKQRSGDLKTFST